mgnify:CR=1 FL=1
MNSKAPYIKQKIKAQIYKIDANADVILFGSRARGEEREDSDWDILILTDYPTDIKIERKFRNELYNLELESNECFSVFVYSKKEWENKQKYSPFYENVTTEGVSL